MKATIERFWKHIEVRGPDECWPWKAAVHREAYGAFGRYGLFGTKVAHRVSWQIAKGAIPQGMFVCHRCDYKPCCNPAHLFLGTPKDNTRDAMAKGRAHNAEQRAAASAAHLGRPMAETTRAALLKVLRGRVKSESERQAIRAAKLGKALSAEHRAKVSAGLKNWYASHPEQWAEVVAKRKGRPHAHR